MFWHGRSFGLQLSNYALWCIFKRTIFGCASWFFNFTNGMSGHHTVDHLTAAMYPVVFTNFATAFMVMYD